MAQALSFRIEVKDDGSAVLRRFTGELEHVGSVATTMGSRLDRAALRITGINQALELAGRVASAVTSRVEAFFDSVVRKGEQIQRVSRQFQLPAEVASSFDFAADKAGIALEGIGFAVKGLSSALVEASQEGTKANDLLVKQFGFTAEQLKALQGDPKQAVLALADAFNRYEDNAQKSVAAQALFGRGMFSMLQLFKEGRPEIEKNIELARRLGLVWSDEDVAAADRLGDAVTSVQGAMDGLRRRIFASGETLNALAAIGERAADGIARFRESLSQERIDAFQRSVTGLVEALANLAGNTLSALIERLPGAINTLTDMVGEFDKIANILRTSIGGATVGGLLGLLVGMPLQGAAVGALAGTGIGFVENRIKDITERFPRARNALRADVFELETTEGVRREQARVFELPEDAQKPSLRAPADRDAQSKADEFARKLAGLRREVAAGVDPLATFQAGIQKAADQMLKGVPAAAALRTEVVSLLTQAAQNEGLAKAAEKVRDLDTQVTLLFDPAQAVRLETAEFTRALDELGIAATDPRRQQLVADFERLSQFKFDKAGADFTRDLGEQLEEAIRPTTALHHEMDALRRKAAEVGRTDLFPLIDQLEEAKRTAGSFFDVVGTIGDAWHAVIDGLKSGTLEIDDIMQSVKASIIGNFADAFADAFQKKLGFEAAFKVNIVQFIGNLGGLIQGQTQGTGFSGVLGQLVGGVFGQSQLGGVAGTVLGGGTTTVGTDAGGSGIPNVPTDAITQPLTSRVANALGFGSAGTAGSGAQFSQFGAGFEGSAAPATQTGSLAGSFATAVAAIGSLVSLALTVKADLETQSEFRQATLGAPQARNFAAASSAGLGLGAGGGAAVGAAAGSAFPGVGTVAGALIGAAIGATISHVISSQTAAGVEGGVAEARQKGLSQEGLRKSIQDNGAIQALFGTGKFSTGGSDNAFFGGGFAAPVAGAALLDFFIPDIEEMFRKIFAKALANAEAGFVVNRKLDDFRGQGVGPQGRTVLATLPDEVRTDTRTLTRIIAGLIGAGTDNRSRVDAFQNILLNSAAAQGKTADEIEKMTLAVTRTVSGGRFTGGLRAVEGLFGRSETFGQEGVPAISPRQESANRGLSLVARAFQEGTPGADLETVTRVFEEGEFTRPVGLKKSRKALREAIPALFSGDDAQSGLAAFGQKLTEVVQASFVKGISKALLQSFVGDILSETFSRVGRSLRRASRRGGITEDEQARLEADISAAGGRLGDLLGEVGKFVPQLIELEKSLEDQITAAVARAAANRGDSQEARRQALGQLGPAIQLRDDTRAFAGALPARIATAQAGGGFEGARIEVANAQRAAAAGKERFDAFVAALGGLTKAADPTHLEQSTALLRETGELRVSALEKELDLLRQQKDAYAALVSAADGLRERVDVLRRGRPAERDILERRTAEAKTAFADFQGADTDAERLTAGQKLAGLLPTVLDLGQRLQAPGGQEFGDTLDFVDAASAALQAAGIGQTASLEEKIGDVTGKLTDLGSELQPVADFFAKQATVNLEQKFKDLTALLDDGGPIHDVLKSIAAELGVKAPDKPAPNPPGAITDQSPQAPRAGTTDYRRLDRQQGRLGDVGLTPGADFTAKGATFLGEWNPPWGPRAEFYAFADKHFEQRRAGTATGIFEGSPRWDAVKQHFGALVPFEHGGKIAAGTRALVGESGPELFVPTTAGVIVPAKETQKILAAVAPALVPPGTRKAPLLPAGALAREFGGPVFAGQRVYAGERGPELFLRGTLRLPRPTRQEGGLVASLPAAAPATAPAAAPAASSASVTATTASGRPVVINLQVGPFILQGGANAEEVARQVADVLKNRSVPQLRDEIARIR